jgi:hypothetical protein
MGSSVAPPAATARMKTGPAITSASLFASRMRFPARAAEIVDGSPAAPTIAAITAWVSGCDATLSRASGPISTSAATRASRSPRRSSSARARSPITA